MMASGIAFSPDELRRQVEKLAPWHYCHAFPFGIMTGTCKVEEPMHPKLSQLVEHGAFRKPAYERVLDLGANSGIISMWFCDNKESLVTAVENGERFFPQLELAVAAKGYKGQITPVNQDICQSAFGRGVYNLVLFLGTMHHIAPEHHRRIFKACFDSLVSGGEIVVQTKTGLPVRSLLQAAGFVDCIKLYTNTEEKRSAWQARKPSRTTDVSQQVANVLGLEQLDDVPFRLRVVEAIGYLALLVHWLRGRINWLRHCEAVTFATEAGAENDDRLNHIGDEMEQFLWEALAPPRAMLPVLRRLRLTQVDELPATLHELLKTDAMGRLSEDGTVHKEAVTGALGWAFEGMSLPESFEDIRRRLAVYGVDDENS